MPPPNRGQASNRQRFPTRRVSWSLTNGHYASGQRSSHPRQRQNTGNGFQGVAFEPVLHMEEGFSRRSRASSQSWPRQPEYFHDDMSTWMPSAASRASGRLGCSRSKPTGRLWNSPMDRMNTIEWRTGHSGRFVNSVVLPRIPEFVPGESLFRSEVCTIRNP